MKIFHLKEKKLKWSIHSSLTHKTQPCVNAYGSGSVSFSGDLPIFRLYILVEFMIVMQ